MNIQLLGVLTFCFDCVTHSMKDLKPVTGCLNEQSAVAMFFENSEYLTEQPVKNKPSFHRINCTRYRVLFILYTVL